MQKKLLVAAVAGALAVPAVANAQSSVQIYGAFDMSLQQYKVSSATAGTASLSKWDVYNQSSRIGFKGTEDMGGGMKAWFQVESNIHADGRQFNNTAAFGTRNTAVGLDSGWGTVLLGNWDNPYKQGTGVWHNGSVGGFAGHNGAIMQNGDTTGANPNLACDNVTTAAGLVNTTTPVCPQLEGSATAYHRRWSNTVQYWSPVFAGGFQAKVGFTANEEKTTANAFNNSPYAWGGSLGYTSSAWRIIWTYEQHNGYRDTAAATSKSGTKDSAWLLGGGYNFGVVDLALAYEQMKYGDATTGGVLANDFKRTNYYIGLAMPIGSQGSAIRAGYSKTPGNKSCGAALACGDTGARAITIGYDHALSKRTSVYIAYGAIRNEAAQTINFATQPLGPTGATATIGAGADPSTLGVGIKHSF